MEYSILIIDDDSDLHVVIADMLTGYGYRVTSAFSAEEAFELLSKNTYHLILLDINLPDSDGFALCKELRTVSTVPVIFASARTSEDDRISGYEIGGDDYLPKPYSMKELLAHVQAILRRTYGFSEEEKVLSFGDICVNMTSRTVTKKGQTVALSLREFDLLAFLCEHKNQAMPKEKILTSVWGAFMTSEASTLTVHMRWLREKLEEDPADPKYLKTVYKVGYTRRPRGSGLRSDHPRAYRPLRPPAAAVQERLLRRDLSDGGNGQPLRHHASRQREHPAAGGRVENPQGPALGRRDGDAAL